MSVTFALRITKKIYPLFIGVLVMDVLNDHAMTNKHISLKDDVFSKKNQYFTTLELIRFFKSVI